MNILVCGEVTTVLVEKITTALSDPIYQLDFQKNSNPELISQYQLVLVINELDTVKEIRKTSKSQPIIFLSEYLNYEEVFSVSATHNLTDFIPFHGLSRLHFSIQMLQTKLTAYTPTNYTEELERIGKIGYWNYNILNDEIFWSLGMYNIFEEEIVTPPSKEKVFNYYFQEDQALHNECASMAIENGTPYDIEIRCLTSKKNKKFIRALGFAEKMGDTIVQLNGIVQDITEKKRYTDQLESNAEELRSLINEKDILMKLSQYPFFTITCISQKAFIPSMQMLITVNLLRELLNL